MKQISILGKKRTMSRLIVIAPEHRYRFRFGSKYLDGFCEGIRVHHHISIYEKYEVAGSLFNSLVPRTGGTLLLFQINDRCIVEFSNPTGLTVSGGIIHQNTFMYRVGRSGDGIKAFLQLRTAVKYGNHN